MNQITIVSLSTGDVSLLSQGVINVLQSGKRLILRTEKHAVTDYLKMNGIPFETIDHLYQSAEDFDAFNIATAKYITDASTNEAVIYAVADASMDSTVETLLKQADDRGKLKIIPSISHMSRCLALVQADMQDIRIVSAERYRDGDNINPRLSCYISEMHSKACAGACKIKLMQLLDDQTEIKFFSADEKGLLQLDTIALYELDRQEHYDHMTAALYIAKPLEERNRYGIEDLYAVMRKLRAKDGCPWDQEQTHESLLTNLLEESYEFIEAARDEDSEHMCEELGDVLLQIVFHAVIAMQYGEFTLHDVTTAVTAKLIERHPHVFGAVKADTASEVLDNWESIKRRQRGLQTVSDAMDNVSKGLSAAMRASKVQHKAAKVGFDFENNKSALAKVKEETGEVLQSIDGNGALEEELGDLLFSVINVCRLSGVNPDIALYDAVNKFISRFRGMEKQVKSEGKSIEDLTLSEMDVYWVKEKHIPKSTSN